MAGRLWEVTREEMTIGTCSVAAPVLDCWGHPSAAVGVLLHNVRVEPAKLAHRSGSTPPRMTFMEESRT